MHFYTLTMNYQRNRRNNSIYNIKRNEIPRNKLKELKTVLGKLSDTDERK